LTNLERLILESPWDAHTRTEKISDSGMSAICCLTNLTELTVSRTHITDISIEKISTSLSKLKTLNLSCCYVLTSRSLEHLAKLLFLENLDVENIESFSARATYSFLEATKSTLKKFKGSETCSCVYKLFYKPLPPKTFDISYEGDYRISVSDDDFSAFVDALGDERCLGVQEICLANCEPWQGILVTERSLALMLKKMKNLKKIYLHSASKINFKKLKLEMSKKLDEDDSNNNSSITTSRLSSFGIETKTMNDADIKSIVSVFQGLKRLSLACNSSTMTDEALSHLKTLEQLEELNIEEVYSRVVFDTCLYKFSLSAIHSFVMARRATLKKLLHNSHYAKVASQILANPLTKILDFRGFNFGYSGRPSHLRDQDVSLVLKLIGKKRCSKIKVIDLSNNRSYVSEKILNVIAKKCVNLQKLDLRKCKEISPILITRFKRSVPSCKVVLEDRDNFDVNVEHEEDDKNEDDDDDEEEEEEEAEEDECDDDEFEDDDDEFDYSDDY
jgi:hypothetical protein